MDSLVLNEETVGLLVGNDQIRQLLPCVELHPHDLVDRAQEEGCASCSGRRRQKKKGRQAQLKLIVEELAECLARSSQKERVKEILGLKNIIAYFGGQRAVL